MVARGLLTPYRSSSSSSLLHTTSLGSSTPSLFPSLPCSLVSQEFTLAPTGTSPPEQVLSKSCQRQSCPLDRAVNHNGRARIGVTSSDGRRRLPPARSRLWSRVRAGDGSPRLCGTSDSFSSRYDCRDISVRVWWTRSDFVCLLRSAHRWSVSPCSRVAADGMAIHALLVLLFS